MIASHRGLYSPGEFRAMFTGSRRCLPITATSVRPSPRNTQPSAAQPWALDTTTTRSHSTVSQKEKGKTSGRPSFHSSTPGSPSLPAGPVSNPCPSARVGKQEWHSFPLVYLLVPDWDGRGCTYIPTSRCSWVATNMPMWICRNPFRKVVLCDGCYCVLPAAIWAVGLFEDLRLANSSPRERPKV